MDIQQVEQPTPALSPFRSLPWILPGVQVACLLYGGLYLAWLGPSISIYAFHMYLLLAALTLFQGLLGVLFLTKRSLLGGRIWASWLQVPNYSTLGCAMSILVGAVLILVTVAFTLLQIHSTNFSFFFSQGGLALVATGMAQGVGWTQNLRFISTKDDGASSSRRLKHFIKIWIGILLYWLIGGILALAFTSFYLIVLLITIGFFGIGYVSSMNLNVLYRRANGEGGR